ncbi:hypothetical protein ACGFRB_23720 [Streptomyces sp. NPDC048718]|uniref:hypothetical protein n=1 Tax=Streptomyces sp. NPDC048718 TaxID=3365587 RepID=UPI00371DCA01
MQLHLKHPLEPDSAPRFAAVIVEAAADISGVELDYGPASLDLVEGILAGFRTDGVTCEEMAESLVAFGCYVGEILARHAGGTWHRTTDALAVVPLVVRLPGARECRPVDWVFGRLDTSTGAGAGLREQYAAAVAADPAGE